MVLACKCLKDSHQQPTSTQDALGASIVKPLSPNSITSTCSPSVALNTRVQPSPPFPSLVPSSDPPWSRPRVTQEDIIFDGTVGQYFCASVTSRLIAVMYLRVSSSFITCATLPSPIFSRADRA